MATRHLTHSCDDRERERERKRNRQADKQIEGGGKANNIKADTEKGMKEIEEEKEKKSGRRKRRNK